MSGLATTAIRGLLVSHAQATGYFEQVIAHEPKSAPGPGVTCAIWRRRTDPIRSSGLASTSVRSEFTARLYTSMLSEPQDGIDITIDDAADALFAAYSGDFELGGDARQVDLLGAYGTPLSLQFGYLDISGTKFRVGDITIPVIINDAWEQSP
jgi:hypothetical protein